MVIKKHTKFTEIAAKFKKLSFLFQPFHRCLVYHQHLKDESVTWSPYFNVSAGLIGIAGYVGEYIKLYGEGGVIGLFPPSEFSSEDVVFGGYGLFGFEFHMNDSNNYFIEIGGVGTGATADEVPTNPIYSNGLLISVGFRSTLN